MIARWIIALLIAALFGGAALASGSDYVFEPVSADVKSGGGAVFAVRLKHKDTGRPVPNALIIQSRLDMTPDGMATHVAPLTAISSGEPGTYAFKADLSMAGRWLLSIAAKVQGEPNTVVGKVIFRATR
jgi:hypothetical protein